MHIHSDLPIDDFNSFTFWRDPLPEVSLDLEVMSDNQDVEQGGRGMRKPTENECETINSSLSLTNSMNTPVSATNQLYGESGVRIHTASISTVSEESVSNIGSTHVLGQNLNEVMDGVVHDMSGSSLGYIDSDSSPDIAETLDEATLAQMQDIVPDGIAFASTHFWII